MKASLVPAKSENSRGIDPKDSGVAARTLSTADGVLDVCVTVGGIAVCTAMGLMEEGVELAASSTDVGIGVGTSDSEQAITRVSRPIAKRPA